MTYSYKVTIERDDEQAIRLGGLELFLIQKAFKKSKIKSSKVALTIKIKEVKI